MSTWISKAAGLLVLAALSACVPAGPGPSGSAGSNRIAVAEGAVTAAVPAGYCFDPTASHDDASGAVMIAGRCATGSGAAPAILTVSIGSEGSSEVLKSGARAMSDWFLSPAGRAALARDGRSASVRVQQTLVADGVLLVLIDDRATGPYWRAFMGLRGRLVSISATATEGTDLAPEAGRKLVERTTGALRAANPSATQ